MPKYRSVLIRSTKLVPHNWCIITKMTLIFSNNIYIIAFQLRNVRTNRIDDAHNSRGGQYLLLRTNRKRTVRGAHKTRDSCSWSIYRNFSVSDEEVSRESTFISDIFCCLQIDANTFSGKSGKMGKDQNKFYHPKQNIKKLSLLIFNPNAITILTSATNMYRLHSV